MIKVCELLPNVWSCLVLCSGRLCCHVWLCAWTHLILLSSLLCSVSHSVSHSVSYSVSYSGFIQLAIQLAVRLDFLAIWKTLIYQGLYDEWCPMFFERVDHQSFRIVRTILRHFLAFLYRM